jgi:hypothetical protein
MGVRPARVNRGRPTWVLQAARAADLLRVQAADHPREAVDLLPVVEAGRGEVAREVPAVLERRVG